MANSTEPAAFARAERRDRAVQLRREGKSIRQIAAMLEVAPSTAWADIKAALEAIPAENAQHLQQVEAERLDALQDTLWPLAMGGDLAAVDRLLKISAQRSALLGLNAPQQVAVSSTAEVDLDATVDKVMAAAALAVRTGDDEGAEGHAGG